MRHHLIAKDSISIPSVADIALRGIWNGFFKEHPEEERKESFFVLLHPIRERGG